MIDRSQGERMWRQVDCSLAVWTCYVFFSVGDGQMATTPLRWERKLSSWSPQQRLWL